MEKQDLIWFRETFKLVDFPIAMFGSSGVGKSSLATNFFSNKFRRNGCKTLIARNVVGTSRISNKLVKFNVWDTAGSNYITNFPFLDLKKMKAAIIVFDVTNYISLETAKKYVKDVRKCIDKEVIALVANKMDLKLEGRNCLDEGRRFAKNKGLLFFETSAKNGTNTHEVFHKLYYAMCERRDMWMDVLHTIL